MCICVLCYCHRVATPIAVKYIISYIISYHIISYILHHIIYHIISYHIIVCLYGVRLSQSCFESKVSLLLLQEPAMVLYQMASVIVSNFSTRYNARTYIPSPHRPPTSSGVQFPAVAEVLLFVVMSILILHPVQPPVQLAMGLFSRGSSGRDAE
jgi:hypothetical protein